MVTCDQLRVGGIALCEGRHLQLCDRIIPTHAGHGQVAVTKRLGRLHVGPADHMALADQEGLDAEAALGRFDGAVFAQQARLAAAVHADQGPVRLLVGKTGREMAAGRAHGDRAQEIIRRGGEGQRLDADFIQRIGFAGCLVQRQAQETRLRFGQRNQVHAAVARLHAAQLAPLLAVVGRIDAVLERVAAVGPVQHQSTELPHLAQVQRQFLRTGTGTPGTVGVAIDGERGSTASQRAACACLDRGRCCALDGQVTELEVIEA